MGDEHDDDEVREDPDRAAILRRRSRLIAFALSGLTTAAGCDEPAPAVEPPPKARTVDEAAAADPPDEAMTPVDVEADLAAEDPEAEALAEAEPVEEGPPDPDEVRHAEERKRRWQQRAVPRPCLSIRRPLPQVCLSPMIIPQRTPQPQACLWKKPVDDPDGEAPV